MSLLIDLLAAGSPGSGKLLWSTWQAAADLAGSRPRLVFVGDALDHWSSTLAATLNADVPLMTALAEVFVCVAVDAAAEPQLAAMVQHALQLTAATTGLPAIAICTPEGQPAAASSRFLRHLRRFHIFVAASANRLIRRVLAPAGASETDPHGCLGCDPRTSAGARP